MKKATMNVIGALLFSIVLSGMAVAQVTIADDEGSNYGGTWANSNNGGFGFNAWSNTYGASTGTFIGNPSSDGMGTTGIGTSAFGMYATSTAYANAVRTFDLGLQVGDTLTFYWAINFDANTGSKGFDLRDGGTTVVNVNNAGSATISYSSGTVSTDYGTNPMLVTLSRTSTSAYNLSITERDGSGTFSASISSSAEIDNINFYIGNQQNGSGQRNMYMNHFEIKRASEITVDGDAGWRLLSLPVVDGSLNDINDDIEIQGISGGANSGSDSNVKTYDDSGSYEDPATLTTAIDTAAGLAIYFYDNTTNGSYSLPLTLDASGSESNEDVPISLNKSTTSGGLNHYFTLVGNPYATNFNLNNLTQNGTGLQDNVHFWDDGAGSYDPEDRTTPFVVSPWQGFWVEVANAGTSTSITFPRSGKSTSDTTKTFFSKEVNNRGDIAFTLSSENSFDKAIRISFRDYATDQIDRADATKMIPLIASFATMAFESNEILKSVESLPFTLEEEITLPMELTTVGVDGEFTFGWNGLETIPGDWGLTLHDYETGADVDMRTVSEYVFTAEADAQAKVNPLSLLTGPAAVTMKAKSEANRFGITIRPTSVNNEAEDSPLAFALDQNYPNPFNPSTTISYTVNEASSVNISVYNLMGQKVATLVDENKSAGQYNVRWNASGVASGMYYYRMEANGQAFTRKMTLIK